MYENGEYMVWITEGYNKNEAIVPFSPMTQMSIIIVSEVNLFLFMINYLNIYSNETKISSSWVNVKLIYKEYAYSSHKTQFNMYLIKMKIIYL